MPSSPHSHRSRHWVGFFVVLAGLALTAIILPLVFNLSIQLRPEQLVEAKQRWKERALLNYDLEYLIKTTQRDLEDEDRYLVQVRNGRVVLVICNSEVRYLDPSLAAVAGLGPTALSSENPSQFGVPALFDEIEATLQQDESSGRRDFATAQFDPKHGHPFHYVHRIRGTKDRVEWNIKMTGVLPRTSAR